MAKNKANTEGVTTTTAEDVTFNTPVREQEAGKPVSEEEARRINGYEGHENIRSQIEEEKARKGVDLNEDTDTGAKKF